MKMLSGGSLSVFQHEISQKLFDILWSIFSHIFHLWVMDHSHFGGHMTFDLGQNSNLSSTFITKYIRHGCA